MSTASGTPDLIAAGRQRPSSRGRAAPAPMTDLSHPRRTTVNTGRTKSTDKVTLSQAALDSPISGPRDLAPPGSVPSRSHLVTHRTPSHQSVGIDRGCSPTPAALKLNATQTPGLSDNRRMGHMMANSSAPTGTHLHRPIHFRGRYRERCTGQLMTDHYHHFWTSGQNHTTKDHPSIIRGAASTAN